jgi:hypothetical protein
MVNKKVIGRDESVNGKIKYNILLHIKNKINNIFIKKNKLNLKITWNRMD